MKTIPIIGSFSPPGFNFIHKDPLTHLPGHFLLNGVAVNIREGRQMTFFL